MKRYLLFGGDRYYPSGGWQDYIGQFDSVVEAMREALREEHSRSKFDWYQVVDTTTAKIVEDGMSEFGKFLRSPDQEDIDRPGR